VILQLRGVGSRDLGKVLEMGWKKILQNLKADISKKRKVNLLKKSIVSWGWRKRAGR